MRPLQSRYCCLDDAAAYVCQKRYVFAFVSLSVCLSVCLFVCLCLSLCGISQKVVDEFIIKFI